MRAVTVSPAARKDLARIAAHLLAEAGRNTAVEVIGRLRVRCRLLAETPGELGTPRPELGPGIRSLPVPPHVLFLRYPDEEMVHIVRVLHQRQDLEGQDLG